MTLSPISYTIFSYLSMSWSHIFYVILPYHLPLSPISFSQILSWYRLIIPESLSPISHVILLHFYHGPSFRKAVVLNPLFRGGMTSKSFKIGQNAKNDQKWSKMAKNGLKWPKMAQNGLKWPKMAQNGLKWPKMV